MVFFYRDILVILTHKKFTALHCWGLLEIEVACEEYPEDKI